MNAGKAIRICGAAAMGCLSMLPASAAEWSLQSHAQVLALTETNPRLASGGSPDAQAAAADADIRLARRTELLDLSLDAHGAIRRYSRDVALDRDEQQLDLAVGRRGERYQIAAQVTAARDTTLTSELGTTGLIQDNQRHDTLTMTLAPSFQVGERTSAGFSGAWQRNRYERIPNSALVDYDYWSAGFNTEHRFTEKATFGLDASTGRLRSDGNAQRIGNVDLRLSADYSWSARWRASASAGVSRVQTNRRQNGSIFNGTLTHQAERFAIDANLGRSVAPTGRGLLSRRDEAGLQLTGRLLENLEGAASLYRVRSRDYVPTAGFSINDVRYTRVEASLNWLFAKDWSLGVSGGRYDQKLAFNNLAGHNLSAWLRLAWRSREPLG